MSACGTGNTILTKSRRYFHVRYVLLSMPEDRRRQRLRPHRRMRQATTTAHLQDILVCRLIRLAEVCEQNSEHPREVTQLLADGLFTTLTNVNFDDEAIRAFTARVEAALRSHGGDVREEDPSWLWRGETDLVSLRSTLLFGLKGMAAYAHHAMRLGCEDETVSAWF